MWDEFISDVQSIDVPAMDRDGLGELAGRIGLTRAVLDGLEARMAVEMRKLGASEASTAETLRRQTGCSAREAKHRARRAEILKKMPNVGEALSSGRLTGEHASSLARAAVETSPEAVDGDVGLLAESESVPADVASTKARDWVRRHQTDDDVQRLHQWQRRNRSLMFGAAEGGMISGIAKFDQVSGAQFQHLVEALADRLYRSDGGRDNPHARTRAQCRHDALLALVGLEPALPPGPEPSSATPEAQPTTTTAGAGQPALPSAGPPAVPGAGRSDLPGVGPPAVPGAGRSDLPGVGPPVLPGAGRSDLPGVGPPVLPGAGRSDLPGVGPPVLPGAGRSDLPGVGPPVLPGAGRSDLPGAGRSDLPGVGPPAVPGAGRSDLPGVGQPAVPGAGHCADPNSTRGGKTRPQLWTPDLELPPEPVASSPPGPGPSTLLGTGDGPGSSAIPALGVPAGLGPNPPPSPGPGLGPNLRTGSECSCRGGFGPKAQLCIVMDLEYVATNGERGRCEIPGIGAMARSELERLGCDADVYGLIFDGRGLPLYHGRKTRRVSPQQWRALVARDRGCVICGAAPNWCQAHHVRYWILGGRTDIDNLALVCHLHHRWIHDNRITLRWGPAGWRAPPGPAPPGLTTRRLRRALQPA